MSVMAHLVHWFIQRLSWSWDGFVSHSSCCKNFTLGFLQEGRNRCGSSTFYIHISKTAALFANKPNFDTISWDFCKKIFPPAATWWVSLMIVLESKLLPGTLDTVGFALALLYIPLAEIRHSVHDELVWPQGYKRQSTQPFAAETASLNLSVCPAVSLFACNMACVSC